MPPDIIKNILAIMLEAALEAGDAILNIYNADFKASKKEDGTPVTLADQKAEDIILQHLAPLNIPVLAEESAAAGNIPKLDDVFFVVDPLDGTKEFIKRNGEFTVNIALIKDGRPICGIVTAPALSTGYIASALGAFSFPIANGNAGKYSPLNVSTCEPLNLVCSRSHADPRLLDLKEKLNNPNLKSVGSSLKICMIASGEAQLYPRFGPTSEWDIAAGEAILQAAGGVILTKNAQKLQYGKASKKFLHPPFVAANSKQLALNTLSMMNLDEPSY